MITKGGPTVDGHDERHVRQGLRIQSSVARVLADAGPPAESLPRILEAICEPLGWPLGVIWVLDDEVEALRCGAIWHQPDMDVQAFAAMARRSRIHRGAGLPGRIWASGGAAWLTEGGGDRSVRTAAPRSTGLRGALAVPIATGREFLGVVELYTSEVEPPDQELLDVLAATGLQVGQFLGRTAAEESARRSEARATAILESALDCVITVDHRGRVLEFNPAAERTFGYRRDDVLGMDLAGLIVPDALREPGHRGFAWRGANGQPDGAGHRVETTALRADGAEVPVELAVTAVPGTEPPVFTGHLRDLSEHRRREAQLAFLAYHDKLTGLPNRAMFEELLEMALERARLHGLAVAVVHVDLDDFKLINDSLGHRAGDDLLREVAVRVGTVSGDMDLVARQGGDEFMLLVGDLPLNGSAGPGEAAALAAEALASAIHQSLREPFDVDGTELYLSASVGISLFPVDSKDLHSTIKNAEAAMYLSKRRGPGGYVIYPPQPTDQRHRLTMATRLRKAVAEERWRLHYQPVLNLRTGRVVGVEALIRWDDPERGLVLPGAFIPMAEEMGLIEPIGEWILDHLLEQLLAWRSEGLDLDVSFNVSPRQLWHPDFSERLMRRLRTMGVDASRVILEITESAAMTDPARTREVLEHLRGSGPRFAIDDFGTGYSSLSRLRDLPVDILKIDRSFVRDVSWNPEAGAMVRAIIQLAHSLGMASLAEGIETVEQRFFLVEQGCQLGQGFLFGRAVPAEEISGLLRGRPEAAGAPPVASGTARRARGWRRAPR